MKPREIAQLVYDVASHRADIHGSKGIDKCNFIAGYLMSELEQVLNNYSASERADYTKLMQERLHD